MPYSNLKNSAFYGLLVYAGLLLFSVAYGAIAPGLDASWGYAMNRFAHGPEIFGRDLIFTYGPLGYLATPEYQGSNVYVAFFAHTALWCLLLFFLVFLWESGQRAPALLFTCAFVLSNKLFVFYWDYLITGVIVIAFVILLKKPESVVFLYLLSGLIGVIFLVKFNGYITAMLLLGWYTAGRVASESSIRRPELFALLAAFGSGPVSYLIYHPSLADLAGYFRGSLEVASGYSSTMSFPGDSEAAWRSMVLFAAVAVSLIVGIAARWISWVSGGMAATLAWVIFKHGWVRADGAHARICFTFLVVVIAFLLAQVRVNTVRPAFLGIAFAAFSVFALWSANRVEPGWHGWWSPVANLRATTALVHPGQVKAQLDMESNLAFANSPINSFLPTLNNSRTLVFPTDLSFGSRGTFQLIPLFATQGYSSYTSYLDRVSAAKIANATPPLDFVVFEWQSIDGRHIIVDVPQIWNALFGGYVPATPELETFLLRPRPRPLRIGYSDTGRQSCPVDNWISVPNSATPIALSLDLVPTVVGKVVTTAYRLEPIRLSVQSRSGQTLDFRLAPDTVSFPFPLNYLPLTSVNLGALWRDNLVRDPIVRFRLSGPGLKWRPCDGFHFYNVTGAPLRFPANEPKG